MEKLNYTLAEIKAKVGDEDHGGYGFKLIKKKLKI